MAVTTAIASGVDLKYAGSSFFEEEADKIMEERDGS